MPPSPWSTANGGHGVPGQAAEEVVAVPTDDDANAASRVVVVAQPTREREACPGPRDARCAARDAAARRLAGGQHLDWAP